MSLKHGLLGLLQYGSMTGYELAKAFGASLSFFWQAQTSQIYRELNAMEKLGWLVSERVIQSEKPNKRVYSITDAGQAALVSWLSSPEEDIRGAMHIRSAFLMRMFFAGEGGDAHALGMLRAYREACIRQIERFDEVPDSIAAYGAEVNDGERTKYWRIVAMYGEGVYRAGLEWADRAIALLEGE